MGTECKHKWIFMESICKKTAFGFGIEYTRTDLFFCEKCLEQKQVKKEASQKYGESAPDWYK